MGTQKDALKATGIMGGAQIISILIRIVRIKVIAVLLGPTGVGIVGLYQATLDIVRSATGLGLSFSAVRDVAEAAGSNDQQRIGRTITILRRWVWLTGMLGMILLLLFRDQFSRYAFNDNEHALYFLILAVVPLLTAISGGQLALLQGLRKIGDMARAGVFGAAVGLCITAPFYWLMGIKGIVPALILSALTDLGLSWYFARKVAVPPVVINWRETVVGGSGMVRLGLFTVITGLATTGTMYLVRIFISSRLGVEGVGQFQAAWNLSAIYVGLVLSAMAADYFPRLSEVNHDNGRVRQLVNEQTEIALLLSGPIIIGVICFMDVVVPLLYSDKFGQSINILLWQTMGNLLKIISWPIGFVILAKGKGWYFIFTELLWNSLFIATVWLLWERFGLNITGIAFTGSYLIILIVIFGICHQLCNFSWTSQNVKLILVSVLLTVLAFINVNYQFFEFWRIISIGCLALSCIYSFIGLNKIVKFKMMFKN